MKWLLAYPDRLTSASRENKVGLVCGAALAMTLASWVVDAAVDAAQQWQWVSSTDGSEPTARHEASGIGVNGKIYLLGGRGTRPVEIFDTESGTWSIAPPAPVNFHHFQAVALGTDIYVIGALIGNFPDEPSLEDIYVFDTLTETWRIEGRVPEARVRGSVAAAERDGWIYLIGGNTRGHDGGAVAWFDRYEPESGTWEILPDAPEARDHHTAAWIDDVLVVSGGRRSALPNVFVDTVGPTDVWRDGSWSSAADIPTRRAGIMSLAYGNEMIVAGGETASVAVDAVEAFDVDTGQWRSLQGMLSPRHGGGAALIGNEWHIVAGAATRGGSAEINSHERLELLLDPASDRDSDGLSDDDEAALGTDPLVVDTDGDGLGDGDEVNAHATSPLSRDTDLDGLDDGQEIEIGTDPRVADSDGDGLNDNRELDLDTDPLVTDSDQDGLNDADEVDVHGTSPLSFDSDLDGLSDGVEVTQIGTNALLPDTDGDRLDDRAEVNDWLSNPLEADTDGDGIDDAAEVSIGTSPTQADSDVDGLSDGEELTLGTDPLLADTDSDGVGDAEDPTPTGARKQGGGTAGWGLLGLLSAAILRRRSPR